MVILQTCHPVTSIISGDNTILYIEWDTGHSEQTAEKHYRAAQPAVRAESYKVVGELVGLPSVNPIPTT